MEKSLRLRASSALAAMGLALSISPAGLAQVPRGLLPPDAATILWVSSSSAARHYGYRMNKTPAELVLDGALGEALRIRRSVGDVKCTKLSAGTYRCSYNLTTTMVPGTDRSLQAMVTGWGLAVSGGSKPLPPAEPTLSSSPGECGHRRRWMRPTGRTLRT